MAFLQRPAVFMERDGLLNEVGPDAIGQQPAGAPTSIEQLTLCRAAGPFVRGLQQLGYLTLVLTHQPGIARGHLSPLRLERIHLRLRELISAVGGRLDGIYHCPHDPSPPPGLGGPAVPDPTCCRKPAPGLLLDAATEHRVDLRRSFLICADADAVAAGHRAGVTSIFVGEARDQVALLREAAAPPTHLVANLDHALRVIRRARDELIERG